jgi:hypothetical protein
LDEISAVNLGGGREAFSVQPRPIGGTQVFDPKGAVTAIDPCMNARGVSIVDAHSAARCSSHRDLFGELVSPTPLTFGFGDPQNKSRSPARTT